MQEQRRAFFQTIFAGASLFLGGAAAARQFPTREPRSAPAPEPPRPDPKEILKANQREIQRDIARLYALAGELKQEVEKTDAAAIYSLTLVRKAEEVEKFARHIKNLARG